MIIVQEETWENIPLLHIVKQDRLHKQGPVVIFLHGFTSAKEHNLHYAFNLAKKGFRVLLPDAHLHGCRDEGLDEVQLSLRFWETVLTSIEEIGVLYHILQEKGHGQVGNIGVGGTSMGGITTLGCLVAYPWIKAATVMMGTPGYVKFAKAQIAQFEKGPFTLPLTEEERQQLFSALSRYDLTLQPQRLAERPIYFWHGMSDTVVPFQPTWNFYESIRPTYEKHPERLRFDTEEHTAHAVSRTGMLQAVQWMATHLKK